MARKATKKDKIVAFKVEESLARFLDQLPNKSSFIRKAIIAQLGMACPLCTGTGVVPRGLHDHYEPILAKNTSRKCDACGDKQNLPRDLMSVSDGERPRFEQFFHGGPFYCAACYEKAPSCDECGWHIPLERAVEHHRKAHTN